MIWALIGTAAAGLIAGLVQEIRIRSRDAKLERRAGKIAQLLDALGDVEGDLVLSAERRQRLEDALAGCRAELDRGLAVESAAIAEGMTDDQVRDDADDLFSPPPPPEPEEPLR